MCLILTQNFALPVLSDIWHFPPQWKHRYKFSWQHRQGVVWQGVFSCGQRAPPSERVAREICPKCIQSLHTPRGLKLVPHWAINRKPNTWHTLKSPLISTFPESHLVWCNQAISEKAMAPHSSTFAWKIPQTEEPGGLQSTGVAKSWIRLSGFTFTFHFHALDKEMATHSSVLAWRIPGMKEPDGLPSMGLHRVGHD